MRKLIHKFNLKLQHFVDKLISLMYLLLKKGDCSLLFLLLSSLALPLFLFALWLLGGFVILVDTVDKLIDYGGENDVYRT